MGWLAKKLGLTPKSKSKPNPQSHEARSIAGSSNPSSAPRGNDTETRLRPEIKKGYASQQPYFSSDDSVTASSLRLAERNRNPEKNVESRDTTSRSRRRLTRADTDDPYSPTSSTQYGFRRYLDWDVSVAEKSYSWERSREVNVASSNDPLFASPEDVVRHGGFKATLPHHPRHIEAAVSNQTDAVRNPLPYQYSPLSQPNTIRLLKLDTAGNNSATITCQLETMTLENAPPFFALSYCWGKSLPDTPILCKDSTGGQGQSLLVTTTLAQALCRLRKLSDVTSTYHRGTRNVGSINVFGEQLALSELKSAFSGGFHSPRCRERLRELFEDLPRGSEEKEIVAGYIRRLESLRRRSPFDMLDDPTGPRKYTLEDLLPVLDQLIQIEESDRARSEAERAEPWELTTKYFWIDQICVDQSNGEEKNSQVKLMGRIYSQAIRTLIWIEKDGEDGDGHLALNLADKIANISSKEDDFDRFPAPVSAERHEATGLPPLSKPEWPALARLLSAQWFNRMWVIQEVVLSQQDSLVLYGYSVHSWKRLRQAATWLFQNAYEGLSLGIPAHVMNVDTFTQFQGEHRNSSLLVLLDQTYNGFCATNPADKVYSLFGLCAEVQGAQWPTALDPNYQLSPWKVFRNVARFLIESTGNLAILSFVCIGGQRNDMPSWVPDLTGSPFYRGGMNGMFLGDDGRIDLQNRDGYQACLGFPLKLDQSRDQDILALRGVLVDSVIFQLEENYAISLGMQSLRAEQKQHAGTHRALLKAIDDQMVRFESTQRFSTAPTANSILERGALLPSLLRIWMDMVDSSNIHYPWGDINGLARSFHRIATAGQNQMGFTFESQEEEGESFRNCAAYLVKALGTHAVDSSHYYKAFWEHHGCLGDPDTFFATARKWCSGRRFFRTAKGLMGMGPGPMKDGDLLCLLFGGGVPYILRLKGNRYIFIGDCYVDGIMEGQALSGITAVDLFDIM